MQKRIFAYCLLLLLSGHSLGNEITYDNALNRCIENQFKNAATPRLNQELDLLSVCPDLSIILATRSNNDFIQPPLTSKTTLNRLLDEKAFRQHPYQKPISPVTNLELVQQLAEKYNLETAAPETPSWWQRIKQWLKDKYGNNDDNADIDWLLKLLDDFSIPDWLYKSVLYGSIGLIIIFAIVIVANEFRHYRRFKNRGEQVNNSNTIPHSVQALRKLNWQEIQALPLEQRTPALLQYLIQQCINREWLPNNHSFTNHEFYQSLKQLNPHKAACFNQVVNAAEQEIYGEHPLSASDLERLSVVTREILESDEALAT